MVSTSPDISSTSPLSTWQRYVVLAAAFLGWMGAGMEMSVIPARPAILHFLRAAKSLAPAQGVTASVGELETQVGLWTGCYQASFLFGAVLGGLFFGWAGDRIG